MLENKLSQLQVDGHITVDELMDIFNLSPASIYRRLNGEVELTLTEFRLIIRHCQSDQVKTTLIEALLRGSKIKATLMPSDLDIDGNGTVDTNDIMASGIYANEKMAHLLKKIFQSAKDGKITASEADELAIERSAVETYMEAIQQIVNLEVKRNSKRRRCQRQFQIQATTT